MKGVGFWLDREAYRDCSVLGIFGGFDGVLQVDQGNGAYLYTCNITCAASGRYGFTVRAVPRGDDRIKFAPGRITWA